MGSVYAALLAAAGNDVLVVDAWEEHVAAIREHGLRVEGASGDRVVALDATTAADPAAGPVDLLVLATKAATVRSGPTEAAISSSLSPFCIETTQPSAARRGSIQRIAAPVA